MSVDSLFGTRSWRVEKALGPGSLLKKGDVREVKGHSVESYEAFKAYVIPALKDFLRKFDYVSYQRIIKHHMWKVSRMAQGAALNIDVTKILAATDMPFERSAQLIMPISQLNRVIQSDKVTCGMLSRL